VSGERAGQPALRLVVGHGLTSDRTLPRERPQPAEPSGTSSCPMRCSCQMPVAAASIL
jgi:hypothetical protein